MWAGWFSLGLVGLTVLVFQTRKVGDGIINADGRGSVYQRWLVLTALLPGLALGSAIVFLFVLGDVITISLVSVGLSVFLGYTIVSFLQIRRVPINQSRMDNARMVVTEKMLYKQFFLLFTIVLVTLLFMVFLFSVYWTFL